MSTVFPHLLLALPGQWMQAFLDDSERVAALLEWAGAEADSPEASQLQILVEQIRGIGGDRVLLKQDPEDVQFMTWAWPPSVASTVEELEAAVGTLPEGAMKTALENTHGYPLIRLDWMEPPAWRSTFALCDPATGRVLLIDITQLAGGAPDGREFWSETMRFVRWVDPVDTSAQS